MAKRTIPQIRARLYELAIELNCPELTTLADETKREFTERTPARTRKVTSAIAAQMRQMKFRDPSLSHQAIAEEFHANVGRVSEALRGLR